MIIVETCLALKSELMEELEGTEGKRCAYPMPRGGVPSISHKLRPLRDYASVVGSHARAEDKINDMKSIDVTNRKLFLVTSSVGTFGTAISQMELQPELA